MTAPATPHSPYAVQLHEGFAGLRFVSALEREFRAEFMQQHLARMRTGFAIGALVYLAFLLLRLRIEAGAAEQWGLVVRSIAIAGTLLPLATSFFERLRPWQQGFVVAGYAVFALGLTGIEIVSRRYGIERHYEGLILASFHIYVFGGLLWRPALVAGAFIFGAYLLGGWAGGLAGREWAYQLLFVALANLIGIGALYSSERVERENFLRTKIYSTLAMQDGLTGLLNRLTFTHQAEILLRQAARENVMIGLVMIDIDHFKAYNDRYGHLAGDHCLRTVAQAVRAEFRRPMDYVARYGGEEFIGLWYDVHPQGLRALAEQVRAGVQALKLTHAGAPDGRVTSSVGAVAFVPAEDDTLASMVQRADRALYEAKERGRNRVVVETVPSRAAAAAARARRTPGVSGAG